jgi:hypothetical protein
MSVTTFSLLLYRFALPVGLAEVEVPGEVMGLRDKRTSRVGLIDEWH